MRKIRLTVKRFSASAYEGYGKNNVKIQTYRGTDNVHIKKIELIPEEVCLVVFPHTTTEIEDWPMTKKKLFTFSWSTKMIWNF